LDPDGFPLALPHQGLYAEGRAGLAFEIPATGHPLTALAPGDRIAACVLSLLPAAYQVKGRFRELTAPHGLPLGHLAIDQVFCASMPLPGKRIYPAESFE
jgi:hypothetical protein